MPIKHCQTVLPLKVQNEVAANVFPSLWIQGVLRCYKIFNKHYVSCGEDYKIIA